MEFKLEKLLVVETEPGLREHVCQVLTGAGYEVRAESLATLKTVLDFRPDVIVLGGNPPQLDCCDLLADVKASEQAGHIRIIMLAPGGSAERVRGLELGADDVLSIPIEDRELLARVHAQMREKKPEDELRETLRRERKSRRQVHRVLGAIREEKRTMRLAVSFLAVFAVIVTAILALSYWRSQKQNSRVYAAIAKLQTGATNERDLFELARKVKAQGEVGVSASGDAQREILKRENQELHDKISTANASEVSDLEKQLRASNARLQKLETESTVAGEVIRSYSSSVCLLHVAIGFRDKASGLSLRYNTLTPPGPGQGDGDNPKVQLGGLGAEVRMDAFGTGFVVSSDGRIVTNHHVVEPWWKNDEIGELLKQAPDIEPVVTEMTAYFPGISRGVPLKLRRISSEADVAIVAGDVSELKLKLLTMDDDPRAALSGEPVVLIGYPTGIDAILARSSEDTLRSIAAKTNGDLKGVISEVAQRKLIRPINTQGHIGDVLKDNIVYDAQTTSGGSGGPLFNSAGKVIAINVAILRDFGGSNFAIPVRYAKRLLTE